MTAEVRTMNFTTAKQHRNFARMYLLEIKYEIIKVMRLPAFIIPTLSFPLLFYVFFGIIFGNGRVTPTLTMGAYLIATYGVFSVMGASLFGFGVGVATERGQGWLQVKRSTPMPIPAYFISKLAVSMLASSIVTLSLFALGMLFSHVRFAPAVWFELFGVLVGGALPFCALGLAIGYFAGPNSAPPMVNLIYLPLSIASGLWIPIDVLPHFMQKAAQFLPPYHLAQLALTVMGAGRGAVLPHIVSLASYSLLFIALATLGYARDEGKSYG